MRPGAAMPERRRCIRGVLMAGIILAGGSLLLPAGPAAAQGFTTESLESAEGYYQLSWEASGPVQLLESESADFTGARTLYIGADTARVVSGKPDGRWFYRLEDAATGEALGDAITVTVSHHPLDRALAFFTIGAVVFAATLVLIVAGSRAVSA